MLRSFENSHRFTRLIALFTVAVILALTGLGSITQAQGQPDNLLAAALKDLNQRLGKNYNYNSGFPGSYSWEQVVAAGTPSLGCPNSGPGIPVISGQKVAYHITIIINNVGTFDYRGTTDGTTLFLCSAPASIQSQGVVQPTVAPQPQQPQQPQQPSTQNPTNYQAPVIAYVNKDGNVAVTSLGVNPGPTSLTADGGGTRVGAYYKVQTIYAGLRWSPEGNALAFARRVDTNSGNNTLDLYVAASSAAPVKVATGIQTGYYGVWSPTGTEIGYVVLAKPPDTITTNATYQVQAVGRPDSQKGIGQPHVVATFTADYFGEGGPMFDPSEAIQINEHVYTTAALAWLPNGIVHALNGWANYGLALSSFDGKRVWELRDVNGAVISPDKTRAVGLQNKAGAATQTPVVINLANGQVTPLTLQPGVEVFGWSADSQIIYYSTITKTGDLKVNGNMPGLVGLGVPVEAGMSATNYNAALWSVPAAGGQSTQLFAREGRGVAFGSIVASPVSQLVAFSFIDSPAALINAINAGQSGAALTPLLPRIRLVTVVPGNPANFFDADSHRPAISSAAQFTAVPAAGIVPVAVASNSTSNLPASAGCPPQLPPRLRVGDKGKVEPGDPNALNSLPAPASRDPNSVRLTPIPANGIFDVIAGPVCAYGYTWWQVRYNGQVGWTAEGEGTTYWVAPLGV